ncbi:MULTISPECIES: hypothetical protein [unclassified Massilia]|uniref:hypothetical protein n=1 Tax=unclassified Massilia TaxID=2609279 RepID=UPI00177BC8F5|nr:MULTISPECIES: hypothetical protein [unclassified Massilia]MBD8529630.1 hypothetical protein [Massilia sp. CFBP 13647]MBD8673283.1 hypothetical protein [Massilia sp. CFBP 13721]
MDLRRVELDKEGKVVRQGPDGQLYVLTDEGNSHILRIVPDKSSPIAGLPRPCAAAPAFRRYSLERRMQWTTFRSIWPARPSC